MFVEMDRYAVANDLLCDSYANWSNEAAQALAEWYEELEQEGGDAIEYDRVAIRCTWSEFTADELLANYGYLVDEHQQEHDLPDQLNEHAVEDWDIDQWADFLNRHTCIIDLPSNNRLLVMEF